MFLLLLIITGARSNAQIVVSSYYSYIAEPVAYFAAPDGGYVGIDEIWKPGTHSGVWGKLRKDFVVSKFDDKMSNKVQLPIVYNGEEYSGYFAEFVRSGNKFFAICVDPIKDGAVANMRVIEIDPLNLKVVDNRMVATEKEIDMKLLYYYWSLDPVIFRSSPSSKKHCVFIGADKKEFFLMALDESLQPLWKGKFEIPKIKRSEIKDIDIDDEGNVFIAGIDKDNTVYLSKYDRDGKSTVSELTMPEGKINNASVLAKKNTNEVFIAGTYSENSKFSNGVFNARLEKNTLELKDMHKEIFPETIVDRLHKDGFARGKSRAYGLFQAYVSGRLFENGDGTMSYVIECIQPLGSMGLQKAVGSLVTTTMKESTNVFSHIPRYEVNSFQGDQKQYYANSCGKNFYLFYYDHEENLHRDVSEDQKVYQGKNGVLTVATINDGKIVRAAVPGGGGLWENIKHYLVMECKK